MVNKFKKKEGNVMEMFCLQLLCASRKYPGPHHGGNWKFWRGVKFQWGEGFED